MAGKTPPPMNLSLCSWVKKLPRKSDYSSPFEGLWPLVKGVFVCTLQPGAQPGPQARAGARLGAPSRSEGRVPPTQPCLGSRVCSTSASTVRASWYEEAPTSSEILDWTKERQPQHHPEPWEERVLSLMKAKCLLRFTRKQVLRSWWIIKYDEHADPVSFISSMLSYHLLTHSPTEYSRYKILSHCKDG